MGQTGKQSEQISLDMLVPLPQHTPKVWAGIVSQVQAGMLVC